MTDTKAAAQAAQQRLAESLNRSIGQHRRMVALAFSEARKRMGLA